MIEKYSTDELVDQVRLHWGGLMFDEHLYAIIARLRAADEKDKKIEKADALCDVALPIAEDLSGIGRS